MASPRFWLAFFFSSTLYLLFLVGLDLYFGTGEMLYQWNYGSKRELAVQLIGHLSWAVGTLFLVLIVSSIVHRQSRVAGWLTMIVSVGIYFFTTEELWLPTLIWSISCVVGFRLAIGGRA